MTAAAASDVLGSADAPPRPALREPRFLRYLGGQSVSQMGNQVWSVTLAWSAVHLASPGVAGVMLTLSSLPRLFLMLFGGVLADRYSIRRLMIGSDILRTLIALGAAGIALLHPGLVLLAVLALTFGVVDSVFLPSAGAMQPRLLKPEQYSGAAIISNTVARVALSIGAPLGGVLVAFGGVPLALAVDAGTFAVSVITLATVRPRPLAAQDATKPKDPYWADFRAGIVFLVRHPLLFPLTLAILVTNAGIVGPMNIGMAELSTIRGWGAAGIGLLLTGFGLGAATGSLLMIRLRIRRHAGTWLAIFGTVQAAAVFSTALEHDLAFAVVGTALAGLCSGPMAVIGSVLSQANTPDEFRGRVSSVTTLIVLGLIPVASAATGLCVAVFGLTATYAVCAGIEASVLLTLFAPAFRSATIAS